MIKFLHIRNLATIEDVEISFEAGFTILTGETGAGKSIIIDSLRLLLGEKVSAGLIRTGKEEATVEAIFSFAGPVPEAAQALAPEGDLVLHRQVLEEGSGKAYAGGVLVPVKKLKEWSPDLLDIYGQNDHIFLLHLENHLTYLDHFAEAMPLRGEVAGLAQALRKLQRERRELEAKARDMAQRLDFLEYQIREIEAADLKPEEEEELHKERHVLKHAEKIAALVDQAVGLAYSEEDSLSSRLPRLQRLIGEMTAYDPAFGAMEKSLDEMSIALGDLADGLRKYQEKQTAAPDRLEAVEERLSLIEKLKRKYGTNIQDICFYYQKIKDERDGLANSQERLAALTREIEATFAQYTGKSGELSRLRQAAARELEGLVEKEIGLLGMKKAKFAVEMSTRPADVQNPETIRDAGLEEAEFLISPNPGEQLRPLRKIASGGELSRIMLAVKALGKEKEAGKTLVFDEIDAGIGGKTAEFIAQKLKQLAGRHQVLCITHLPQIASFASHHYRIDKRVEKDRTFTKVKKLSFEERVEEIAQLLSGTRITESALQNAREMLVHNLGKA